MVSRLRHNLHASHERLLSSSSGAAGDALRAFVVPSFAGASSVSVECADTARFADPGALNAEAEQGRAADDDYKVMMPELWLWRCGCWLR
jgi:hypothetical protein